MDLLHILIFFFLRRKASLRRADESNCPQEPVPLPGVISSTFGSWGGPSSIKRWQRWRRREFGALKSHLPPFSGWTQRFSGKCPFYLCACSCHVPLTIFYPIPTTPCLGLRKKPGKGKHRQNSCRSSWVRCQSILHSFFWPYSAIHYSLLQSPSPPPAHGSSS